MKRLLVLAAAAALALVAHAQNFPGSKPISIVVPFAAGGPTDTEGRLVARHLGRHIPGNPTIVPRNMTGAGGIVAANWLGQVAPPDGLNLGFFSGVASASVMGVPSLKTDIANYSFAGSGWGVSVAFIRKNAGSGVNAPEDLMRQKDFWIGGLAIDSDKDLRMRLQLDLLGIPYKYVTGYPGAADVRLAIQRGEVQMTAESLPSYRASVEPNLIATGDAIALWLDIANEASAPRPKKAEGIKATTFYDYFLRVKGKPPEGLLWEAFDITNTVARGYERIMVMPPGVPSQALADVKTGIAALASDPDFLKDAMATMRFAPDYETGAEFEATYKRMVRPDPRLIAFFKDYIEEGQKQSKRK